MLSLIKPQTERIFRETVLPQMIIFLIAGFYSIGDKSFWVDEIYTMEYIADYPGRFFSDANMFFYYGLLKGWTFLGDSEGIVRALSVIFVATSMPGLLKVGEILFNKRVAQIAVWLMAINPIIIQYAQMTRSYSLLICLTIWSTFVFIKVLRQTTNVWRVGYIALATALIYTHFFGILIVATQLLTHTLIVPKKVKEMIFSGLFISIFTLPLLSSAAQSNNRLDFRNKPGGRQILNTFKTFSGDSNISLGIYGIFFLGNAYWMFVLIKKKRPQAVSPSTRHFMFILLWLTLPILLTFVFSVLIKPVYSHNYLLICYPAFILLAAFGLTNLSSKLFLNIVLVACVHLTSFTRLLQVYKTDTEPWRSVVEYVGQSYQPGDAVIVYAYFTRYSFEHYLTRSDFSKNDIRVLEIADGAYSRGGGTFEPELNFQLLSNLDKSYSRVWLILSHHSNVKLGRARRTLQIHDAMRTKFVPVDKNLFGKIEVYSYHISKIKP